MGKLTDLTKLGSYDVELSYAGRNDEKEHMVKAKVTLLEEGAKEVTIGEKKIKEVTKMTNKVVSTFAKNKDYQTAKDSALNDAITLLGLGE